jgi:hypothetical protein
MINLSQIIIENPQVKSFKQLLEVVEQEAKHGTLHLQFDVKPDFRDTPRNWEFHIESAFYRGKP